MSLVDVFGVLEYSWEWLFDFTVMAIFVTASLAILFGRKWIRIGPAGPIFLSWKCNNFGIGFFLSL